MTKVKTSVKEISFVRFSDSELKNFEKLILVKLEAVKKEISLLKGACRNPNGTDDTGKAFIQDQAGQDEAAKIQNDLEIGHFERHEVDLKHALNRVHSKQYGICRITGQRIPKQRLLSNLTATTCVEAKKEEDKNKKVHKRR
ncbi:MAG: TraR/DksA family transcriptional regulator [Candidatus Pacebacteria bacterium]|nr:TraR/DksA family transcriptional regulator [Candidatus Paceibacterota bacterium]